MDFYTDIPAIGSAVAYLPLTGGQMQGSINMAGYAITQVVLSQKYTVHTLAEGETYTLFDTFTTSVLSPAGTLAAATIIFPAAPVAGQNVTLACSPTGSITTLTLQANSGQVLATGNITSFTPGQFATWIAAFIGPTCYWVRTA